MSGLVAVIKNMRAPTASRYGISELRCSSFSSIETLISAGVETALASSRPGVAKVVDIDPLGSMGLSKESIKA
ncbi:hypothetical protein T05_5543 [Trichinella murrelli]|uniref:Uncharacterized protein n=1 Tax=Trichinella murrelli TaxID=144512 RepID=A0A0V0SS71_9BILA|nr:hypothetical protein T05_5543 [Trichinella murrelli]